MFNDLLKKGIFTETVINVNSQRMVKRRPEMLNAIYSFTSFLPSSASLKERIFVIFSKLNRRPTCAICNAVVLFEERGKPSYNLTCSKSCANSLRLKSTSEESKAIIIKKRNLKLNEIGPDGLTGQQRRYKKAHQTKVKNGLFVPYDKMSALQLYRAKCLKASNTYDLSALDNFYLRGTNGTPGAYQLDHLVSISYGFKNNIDPKIIGHICNLEMVPWLDNVRKNMRCSISINELMCRISKYET